MLAEIKEMFLSELDFLAEGRNQEEIRRFFRPKPEIIVPKVYWSHSSPHVLTMEYVESEKISDFALREKSKSKRKAVVARLLEYYLEQIFKNDIYHCDPHPGNIGIAKSGALVVYDYGAVGKLKKERVEQLSKSLKAFLNNDLDGFIKALEKLGLLDLSVNREKKVALLSKVFEPVLSFYHGKSSEHNYDLKGFEADFGQLLLEENTFCLPPDLCGVLRSITSLEGVLRMLQPDINIPKALVPFVKDWLVEEGLEQGQKRKVGKK
jgi:predicted unusual protein kinase regulating ubiquinone biosynthesis (AarF/ABC1/UbiB family)